VAVRALAVHGTRLAVAVASERHVAASYTLLFEGPSGVPVCARRHADTRVTGLVFLEARCRAASAGADTATDAGAGADTPTGTRPVLVALTDAGTFVQAFPEDEPVDAPALDGTPVRGASALARDILAAADGASTRLLPEAPAPHWDAPRARPQDLLLASVPSHALPSMRLLFAAFIKHRLVPL
jgi:hypothetical protein